MKRIKIFTLVLFGLLTLNTAQAQKKKAVEVPMKFMFPTPAVEVMINGQGPFLFIIDTGGQGEARVTPELVEKLGLKTNGEIEAHDGTGKNVQVLKTYAVDSIDVAGMKFENLTAAARRFPTRPDAPKIDGMLAFNLFKDHLLTLDFPAQKVRIETGSLPKANGKNILDYDNTDDLVWVELLVGDQKVKMIIDSGNMLSIYSLPTFVVEKAQKATEPVVVGRARTISNDIEVKRVNLKDTIRLGKYEFPEPTVLFPALSESTGNIGSKFLKEFAVTFDQRNIRLKLEKAEKQETGTKAKK